jgi:hypothetical protein
LVFYRRRSRAGWRERTGDDTDRVPRSARTVRGALSSSSGAGASSSSTEQGSDTRGEILVERLRGPSTRPCAPVDANVGHRSESRRVPDKTRQGRSPRWPRMFLTLTRFSTRSAQAATSIRFDPIDRPSYSLRSTSAVAVRAAALAGSAATRLTRTIVAAQTIANQSTGTVGSGTA